jgi:Ser/Thr protein kinase RdoA (MazF antagonist)|tara:strand:- start:1324 stop:2274 length:951 start_codon:yes stop_codon:yes gene_type:complete
MIKNSEIKKILSKEGLNISSIKKLDIGTSRNSYLLISNKKKYVLKLYDKKEKGKIQKKIDYIKKINKKKKITTIPINSKVLKFKNTIGYFYEFFEGVHYREIKIPRKLFKFGQIVGEFSKQSSKITSKNIKYDNLGKRAIKDSKKTIKFLENKKGFYKETSKIMKEGLPLIDTSNFKKCRMRIVHGDIHFENVLYNKKQNKYQIIDIDGTWIKIIPIEILVIISYSLSNSTSNNKRIIKEIIKGYESKFKLTRSEKQSIPSLLILRKNGEIIWLLDKVLNKRFNEKEFRKFTTHSRNNLRTIIDNFEELKKIFNEI